MSKGRIKFREHFFTNRQKFIKISKILLLTRKDYLTNNNQKNVDFSVWGYTDHGVGRYCTSLFFHSLIARFYPTIIWFLLFINNEYVYISIDFLSFMHYHSGLLIPFGGGHELWSIDHVKISEMIISIHIFIIIIIINNLHHLRSNSGPN